MNVPKIISVGGHEYIFYKKYPNFYMYREMITGWKECFSLFDIRRAVAVQKIKNGEV